MTTEKEGMAEALSHVLDLLLEAYALSFDVDPEVASFTTLAVLVVGERFGMSDEAMGQMCSSAVAEARRLRNGGGEPPPGDDRA